MDIKNMPPLAKFLSTVASIATIIAVYPLVENFIAERNLDIHGKWVSETANMKVLELLKQHKWSLTDLKYLSSPPEQVPHRVYDEYELIYSSSESKVLIVISDESKGISCHACAPFISVFKFDKLELGWKLTETDIAVTQFGSWGKFDDNRDEEMEKPGQGILDVRVIGVDRYGLFLSGGYSNTNSSTEVVSIYTKVSGSYKNVLDIITFYNYGSNSTTEWSASYSLKEKNTGLYNIIVNKSGVENTKLINEKNEYEFTGKTYVAVN